MKKNLQKIIIGLFLILTVSGVAQERCLSEAVHKRLLQTDPQYASNILANEAKIQNIINNGIPKSGSTYVIPVVVHVMHLGEAVGTGTNISTAQIQSAIDNLNTCFGGSGAYPLDIEVQFQLAVRDPNCNPTTGIVRVDASGTSNYATNGIQNDGTDITIRSLSIWPSNEYYNIWIVNEIDNNDGGVGTQGFAYYPGGGPNNDGAVILYNAFGYDPTNTLGYTLKSYTKYNASTNHELGHAFNLKHTFQGDDANNDGTADQCPVNTTCTTDGDLCCDTEAHRRDDGNCGATGNSCTGQSLVNVVQNIMAYSSDYCQVKFTPDQKTRMRAAISTLRASLLTSPGLVPISGTTPSSAVGCSPQTTNLSNSFAMGVFGLTIENTSYTSGGAVTDGGFKTKWCNNFSLNTNTLYSISVTTGNANQEKIKVYIDYNNDGDFADAGEEIFADNTGSLVTHSGSFTSATAPVTGQSIWLRVISDFYGNTITDPCYQPVYGQVEDFSVIIATPCTPPGAPTGLAAQSFCSGVSPTVADLAATGTAIKWYAASTGGTAKLTTEALVTGTHYWASQTVGGCESSARFEVIATINTTPAAPTGTAAQSFCSGISPTVANLAATGTAIQWYAASTGGTAKLSTEALITGTHYWASQTISGCESSARFDVTATINTSSTAPTVGTITQPTCTVATGSVILNGLPPADTWTLTMIPGGTTTTGTGTSTTITGLNAGTITYTVSGSIGCVSTSSASIVINSQPITPTAPTVGTITQPTCTLATGDVVLNGLPAAGSWTLTVSPGGATTTGTGTSSTLSGLASGTYTYTVTNASACVSPASANVVINTQPITPTAPTVGTITQPTCTIATGDVVLNGLPAAGSWTLTVSPGGTTTTGTGTSSTLTSLSSGTYTYTVTNASACVSPSSANVVINAQPITPTAPTVGTITQPTCTVATGDVVLNDLPAAGTWTLTVSPGGTTTTGTGTSSTLTGLSSGTYTYTVTNASACVSPASANVAINTQPITPTAPTVGTITQPSCTVATGDVVLNDLPAAGTWTLTVSPGGTTTTGTGTSSTLTGLSSGTYTYTVTNASACVSPASANVVINTPPITPTAPTVGTITQPTCTVATGDVVLNDLPAAGTWTLTETPSGTTSTGTGTSTTILGLNAGTYSYTVTNASNCTSAASASITINAQQTAPTIGTITQPTCAIPTGDVILNDLPATGSWTLTMTPGGTTTTGTGTSTTITGLITGTYSYTVTNASSCTSSPSANVVINAPTPPAAPAIGTITQPTCIIATGDVILNSLPASGIWTLTVTPGGTTTTGTGTSSTITGLVGGTYSYTVTDALACTSSSSANVVISTQPITPPAPTIGTITQPTCTVTTGDAIINGLPGSGTWILTVTPGGTTTTGTGISSTLTTLIPGTYSYTVTNASGCTSATSAALVIDAQPIPTVNLIANNNVCNGDTIAATNFSSTPSGATYDWANSDNTIGLASTGAGDITEFAALNSTNSSVTATITITPTLNGCVGTSSSFTITVKPTPIITANGTILTAPASTSYQWYLDGQIIGGATNQSYTVTQNGDFSVIVNGNACPSDNINFSSTDINKLNNNYFLSVYPNPANGNCNITFTGIIQTTYKLKLQNTAGTLVYQEIITDFNGSYSKQIDLAKLGKGIYLISVSSQDGEVVKKVVVY